MFSEDSKKKLLERVIAKIHESEYLINKPYYSESYSNTNGNVYGPNVNIPVTTVSFMSAQDTVNLINKVSFEVGKQIGIAVATEILTQLYTHEDFEKDLGLK